MTVRWSRVGPALAVVAALAVSGGLALTDDDGTPQPTPASEAAPVPITSDAPRFERLEQLVAASDLVVRGTVVAVEPGRVFGDPGQAAVRSRLVTLTIDEVVAGSGATGSSLVVEEPGWLDDGTPIEVDGVPASAVGTTVLWFLQSVPPLTSDAGSGPATYVLTGPQGHYVVEGDRLLGAGGDEAEPLARRLEDLGLDGLRAAIRGLVAPTSP